MNDKVNQQEAENTVFSNLGMTKEELGVTDTGSDTGSGNENERGEQGSGNEGEQSRVTHTERQYEDLDARPQSKQQPADFREPRQFPKNAPVRPDSKGNLLDAQGRIVARAGKEARLYTERHNARVAHAQAVAERDEVNGRLEKAIQIGQELYHEVERYKATNQQIAQLGLQPAEMLQAAQFASEAKTNPLGTLKKLLTMAAAQGIDLTQLGMPQGSGVDPKSLMDMIRSEIGNQMKPVRDRTEAEQRALKEQSEDSAAQQQVEGHVRKFFTENPGALPHMNVFQAVLSNPRFAGMSLGEIWARIQLNAVRIGRPLNGPRRPSLPNGRGRPAPGISADIASPDKTYDQIINDILRLVP